MKKLLICSDSFLPRWDGVARFLSELIPRIKDEYEIRVLVPRFPGELDSIYGVTIVRLPLSKLKAADYVFSRPRIGKIRAEVAWADIVWTHTIGPIGATAILTAHAMKKRLLAYIHSVEWELFSKSLSKNYLRGIVYTGTKALARVLYNKCTLLMIPTLEFADQLKANKIKAPAKPVFLGVDTNKFVPPLSKPRAKVRIGLDGQAKVVGYCGRIGREKDLLTLYRGFMRARRQIPGVKLVVVGAGVKDLDKLFRDKTDVLYFGTQDHVIPYIQAMDVSVLPSLTETTSLSTLEAMSCEVPVIVTKVGQVKDYVREGKNGLFFPQKDPYELSKKIIGLLNDEKARYNMGRAARATVVEMYSFEKTLKDIREILAVF